MGKQTGRISKWVFPTRPTIGTFTLSKTEHFLTGGDNPELDFLLAKLEGDSFQDLWELPRDLQGNLPVGC